MSRRIQLIGLIIVLLALSGITIYLNYCPDDKPVSDSADSITYVTKIDEDDIAAVSIKYDGGSYTVVKDGDNWTLEGFTDGQIDEAKVKGVPQAFQNMIAVDVIGENAENKADFGLKTPNVTATVTLKDGTKKTVYIGDRTVMNDKYYAMVDDDQAIYTISLYYGNVLSRKLNDLRDHSIAQFNIYDMKYLKIDKGDGRPIELVASDNIDERLMTYGLASMVITSPYKSPGRVADNKLTETADPMGSGQQTLDIKAVDFVEEHPTDLAQYGLDKPRVDLVMKDSKSELHLLIGKDKDDKLLYCKVAGSDPVYTVDKSSIKFIELTPFDWMSNFVSMTMINNVSSIDIKWAGHDHKMTIKRTVEQTPADNTAKNNAGDSTSGTQNDTATTDGAKDNVKEETVETYFIDGKQVQEGEFKSCYEALIGVTIDAELDKTPTAEPEFEVTFNYNSKLNTPDKADLSDGADTASPANGNGRLTDGKNLHIAYTPYNRDFYAVSIDGVSEFVVSRDKVKKAEDAVIKLTQANEVKNEE